MTLNSVLKDIRKAYSEVCEKLSEFMDIEEVRSFVHRRGQDLEEFENLVKRYNGADDILSVQQKLRQRGTDSKIFGGICMKREEYFVIPKKIEMCIEQAQIAMDNQHSKDETINYDKDYAIPDEISEQVKEELFE